MAILWAKHARQGPSISHIKVSSCPVVGEATACRSRSMSFCSGDISAACDRGLPGGNPVLEIDPVARRHAEQVRRPPHDVILELADLAVGVNQLPHHLDDAEPAVL